MPYYTINTTMDPSKINYLAVATAAVSTFILGALWYSPALFGKAWMKENGFTDDDMKKGNMAKTFGFSFIFALVMAFNLATFLADDKTDMSWGMTAGALAGFGWVFMGIAVIALFEMRSWKYIFINGGYHVLSFIIMGAIIGAWR